MNMTNHTSAYYYNQLNKDQQKAYHAILEGLRSLAPVFPVPRLSARELADIYFFLRLDHPEIFYTVSYRTRAYPDALYAEMLPDYMFEKKKIQEHQKALNSRINKLIAPARSFKEKEQLQYIHDFICRTVTYDKLKKPYSHEIIGALGNSVAVCEGIAKAVKILCDQLGIWCIIALAEANPEKGIRYRHAWNVVRIQGNYYHLDATFDNTLGKQDEIRYDYYNLDDKQIFRDHEPVIRKVPACTDSSLSYYKEKKLAFTRYEDVKKRSEQAAHKGNTLTFQWRGGYLTREVLQDLLTLIRESGESQGKYAVLSLNWPQSVLRIQYLTEKPAQEVTLQEADEGNC